MPERRKGGFGAPQEGGKRTLLSERDANLLRMACWCQYLSADDAQSISSREEIDDLLRMGLIKIHRNSGAYVLTGKGVALLSYMLDGKLPEITQSYHPAAIKRRLRRSRFALTVYQAGLNPFIGSTTQLQDEGTVFFTAFGRGRGQNPWGSTRIAAVVHMGGVIYAAHDLYPEIGPVTLTDELTAFGNNTAHLDCARRGFLFAGDSYGGILEELAREGTSKKTSKKVSYGEAYFALHDPVHLLSCDKVGSMQLKIMSIPHYRMKLTKAALMQHYRPPPADVPEWDAMYGGTPLILAADMDLRRVDAGIETARVRGYAHAALLALKDQADMILYSRYGEDGFTEIYCITEAALQRFAGGPMELHSAKPTQFLTLKGGVIDTPLIQSY